MDTFGSGRVSTVTLTGNAGPLALSAALARKRLGLRSTWFTVTPSSTAPAAPKKPRVIPKIALTVHVARNRVLLSGTAPAGAATATLQGRAGASWRDIVTRQLAPSGTIAFRRPVGEALRYRLVAGSLSSAAVPVVRRSGILLRGRPGARLSGRLYPSGARGTIVLQHVVGGLWSWVARTTTKRDGSFRFKARATRDAGGCSGGVRRTSRERAPPSCA